MSKWGVAKPSTFAVNITPPAAINDPFIQDLPFFVSDATLPSMFFDLSPIAHKGYGLMEQRPIAAHMDQLPLILIGDAKGRVLSFFDKWCSLVYNFDGESNGSAFGLPSEMFNYPDQYWGTVEIFMYDIAGDQYYSYKLDKAFPTGITGSQVGWNLNDSLMQISTSFAFRSFTTKSTSQLSKQATPVQSQVNSNARNLEMLQSLLVDRNSDLIAQRLQTI